MFENSSWFLIHHRVCILLGNPSPDHDQGHEGCLLQNFVTLDFTFRSVAHLQCVESEVPTKIQYIFFHANLQSFHHHLPKTNPFFLLNWLSMFVKIHSQLGITNTSYMFTLFLLICGHPPPLLNNQSVRRREQCDYSLGKAGGGKQTGYKGLPNTSEDFIMPVLLFSFGLVFEMKPHTVVHTVILLWHLECWDCRHKASCPAVLVTFHLIDSIVYNHLRYILK